MCGKSLDELSERNGEAMKISTQQCKEAIIQFVLDNPGHVSKQFIPMENEEPAKKISNWKRISKTIGKHNDKVVCVREFDCAPYDDQLRATTWDNGEQILDILIEGV